MLREEVTSIPEMPAIIASGPLTSPALSQAIQNLTGAEHLYFFDAIAPIVTLESINFEAAFRASRFERGELEAGDYINCPLTRRIQRLHRSLALRRAHRAKILRAGHGAGRESRSAPFLRGLPAGGGAGAARGTQALAFGPMRPVGLKDPRTDAVPTPWCSCARTIWRERYTTWSVSRPT